MPSLAIDEVSPGIWRVRRGVRGGAAYLVKTSPGAVIVDAGADPAGADVMRALQTARVGLHSIGAVLLTHAHCHAASGALALRARSGAKLYCSAEERASSAAPVRAPLLRFLRRQGAIPIDPDGELVGGDVLENFEVIATPGHTEGHLSFLYRPARILFAGDALRRHRSAGAALAPGTRNASRARESMRKCLAAGAELILPSHGPPLAGEILSGYRAR